MKRERPDSDRQAHLRDYWRTVWSERWTVAKVFLVVVAVGMIASFVQTPVYRATATVEISPRAARVVKVDDVSQIGTTGYGWAAEDRYLKTQMEILKSRDVAGRTFEQLGLAKHPSFSVSKDPLRVFMARIEVEPTPETNIVAVSMEGTDPAEVAEWVNSLVEGYVDRNIEQAAQSTAAAIDALLSQMQPLREKVQEEEQEKFRYAREEEIYIPETQQASYNERIVSLERDYTATKLKRLELEAVFLKIEEIDRAGGDYYVIPQVANDMVLRDLMKERGVLEAEHRKLLVIFKTGHFKVKENEATLEKVNERIDSVTNRIISAIRTEYTLAQAREGNLEKEIDATKREALEISERSSAYNMLQTESVEAKRIYDLVAQRVKEVDLNSSVMRNNVQVLDRATVPARPERPRKIINLAVSMLMGIGLGIGLVFFLDYLDNTVRSAEQLHEEFGLATLAVVPRRRPETEGALSEAFNSLRTSVQFASRDGARRVLLITGPEPETGKTLTSVMLARAMVRAGDSICLVDADLRRPAIHEQVGLPSTPGLTNYVSGDGGPGLLRTIIRSAGEAEPSVITCGPLPPSPAEMFASDMYARLVQELKTKFDWVIIDSPPAAGLTDSVLLASRADMVLMVVRQGKTNRDVLRRALEAIGASGATILGAVLNDVDLSRTENRELYYPTYDLRAARRTVQEKLRRPAVL